MRAWRSLHSQLGKYIYHHWASAGRSATILSCNNIAIDNTFTYTIELKQHSHRNAWKANEEENKSEYIYCGKCHLSLPPRSSYDYYYNTFTLLEIFRERFCGFGNRGSSRFLKKNSPDLVIVVVAFVLLLVYIYYATFVFFLHAASTDVTLS